VVTSDYQTGSMLSKHLSCAGLVYNLTEYLASHGINIESLETYTQEVRVLTTRFSSMLVSLFLVFLLDIATY
jgi:hypothetical protein